MSAAAPFFALDGVAPKAFDRKAFMREVYREEKRKARVHLTQLRVDLKPAREKRKQAVVSTRERCRAHRLEVRERLYAHRLKVLAELRETLKAERLAAREECSVDLGKARAIKDEIESSKAKVEAERTYQRKMRHLDRDHSDRLRAHKKTTARERHAESDDLVALRPRARARSEVLDPRYDCPSAELRVRAHRGELHRERLLIVRRHSSVDRGAEGSSPLRAAARSTSSSSGSSIAGIARSPIWSSGCAISNGSGFCRPSCEKSR